MVFYIDGNKKLAKVITLGIEKLLGDKVPVHYHESESEELLKYMKEATVFKMTEAIHKFNTVIKNIEKVNGVHILNISPLGAKQLVLNNPKTKSNEMATSEVKKNFNIKLDCSYLTHILLLESVSEDKDVNEYVKEIIKSLESGEKNQYSKITQIVRDQSIRTDYVDINGNITTVGIDGVRFSNTALLKIARIIENKYKYNTEKEARNEAKEAKKQEKLRKKLAKKKPKQFNPKKKADKKFDGKKKFNGKKPNKGFNQNKSKKPFNKGKPKS